MLLNPYRFSSGGGGSDPYFGNVATLLHLDGSHGSTTFTDVKGIAYSGVGTASLSTAEKKFGTASLACTSGGYITASTNAALNLGSASFTMEMWLWVPSALTSSIGLVFYVSGNGFEMSINSSNKILIRYRSAGTAITGVTNFPRDQWVHLAIVRDGTSISIYQNGVLDSSATVTNPFANGNFQIGAVSASSWYLPGGYIDDFRLTTTVARYTSNFTPPAAPFPDS